MDDPPEHGSYVIAVNEYSFQEVNFYNDEWYLDNCRIDQPGHYLGWCELRIVEDGEPGVYGEELAS